MRICVFGTGAVGAYFGGRLAEAGEEVVFVARGEALRALRERGLRVASTEGDFTLQSIHASDNPAELAPADAIVVGVKAWQVSDAARAIAPALGPDTFVVPLDRKSTRLNSSHVEISYAVFCLKKKKKKQI